MHHEVKRRTKSSDDLLPVEAIRRTSEVSLETTQGVSKRLAVGPKIQLRDVHLVFRSFARQGMTLKELVLSSVLGRPSAHAGMTEVRALRGIDLTVSEGERLGVIGHNGAGKSTLLKLLAGIYVPSQGTRIVQGRINSLLELGVGIEPDANGWDNIAFRGYLQGQTPRQIAAKRQQIAEFSELGEFMDMPVRYYSTGMMVRLVFSIASEIDPEILLLDEIFSAGDASFQEKARRRMMDVIQKSRIMVMASHDLETLRDLCTKVLWLDHGQVRELGPPSCVIGAYQEYMRTRSLAA